MPESAEFQDRTGPDAAAVAYHPRTRLILVFYAGILAIALFPVLAIDTLPLADLPNHLARVYILNNLATDADLQKYYAVHWHLLSFQSTDFLLPPLAKLVGLFPAARVYIVVTFMVLLGGVAALHRALFGRVGLWPGAASLFLYNFLFAWGLISYLFASGLALLLFAAWIATRERRGLVRLAIFGLATVALFLCHFFGFVVYAVLVLGYQTARLMDESEAGTPGKLRALIESGLQFVIPTILFLISLGSELRTVTVYGTLTDKLRAALSPTTMYLNWSDFALSLAATALLWLCMERRLFRFAGSIWLALLGIVLLAIVMPDQLASVWGADFRLPTLIALLAVASTDLTLTGEKHAAAFVVCLAVLMLARVAITTVYWQGFAADFDEFRVAAEQIDRGSRVIVIQDLDDHRAKPAPILFPYRHVAALAVIERDVFLPHLFTVSTPLEFANEGRALLIDELTAMRGVAWHPSDPAFANASADTIREANAVGEKARSFDYLLSTNDWSAWPEHFDYLVALDFGRSENPVPALLTEIGRGSYFTIYRIHPPGQG